ncbi:tetratricopeptide repeat protein [Polynucleobacter paneuropaeus]|uniref:tetratricopeptide repeat protein n=1 Tax=Polynucleobacter paneuropaeus TaxID=2527775 RepID=UPI001BFD3377|nr:tetratricopeptide repeat protein [Polynucleobacter paneuropaeus]MBT8623101.1 tetratricopeptide repeat protein [Polynucleobacter paneuropaeus]
MPRALNIPQRKLPVFNKPAKKVSDSDASKLFSDGIAFAQQGKFQEAEINFLKVLEMHPLHLNTLQILAEIMVQTKRYDLATEMLMKAATVDQGNPQIFYNLGLVYQLQRKLKESIASYKQGLAIYPENKEAHSNLGLALADLNDFTGAITYYDYAITIDPDFAQAHNNRGVALAELKRFDEAVASYDKAIHHKPDYAEAYNNRGLVLHRQSFYDLAIASYDKAIHLKPTYAEAHNNRGVAFAELKNFDSAILNYDAAILINPIYMEAYSNRGTALAERKDFEGAIESYDKAIHLKSDYAEAYNNRGFAFVKLKKYVDAIASFDRAIELNRNYSEAYNNFGIAYLEQHQYDLAHLKFDKAIALNPQYADVYSNLAMLFTLQKQYDLAIKNYDIAINLKPNCEDFIVHKSFVMLVKGNFDEGLKLYENRKIRLPSGIDESRFRSKAWDGTQSLSGKKILIHFEQGYGDTIQFCRFLPLITKLGGEIILEVQKPLRELFRGMEGVSLVMGEGEPTPDFDYQCSLMRLPFIFNQNLESISGQAPYISSIESRASHWQNKLGEKLKPRIGLVWSGNPEHKNDSNRSIHLKDLIPFLPDQFQYFSLQKDIRLADALTLNSSPQILNLTSELSDYAETAALVQCMDIVITVDTSVAHLAGAMGKETWVLLPYAPDWRWLLDREDSPWYSSMTLIRQDAPGDWSCGLQKVNNMLSMISGN